VKLGELFSPDGRRIAGNVESLPASLSAGRYSGNPAARSASLREAASASAEPTAANCWLQENAGCGPFCLMSAMRSRADSDETLGKVHNRTHAVQQRRLIRSPRRRNSGCPSSNYSWSISMPASGKLRRQPSCEATSSKHRASRGSGCGFRRERGSGPSVNRSVLAQDYVTEASAAFCDNREAERKIVPIDGAHSVNRLIVCAYPNLRVRPVYPGF
jgi:hypothetical protein